MYLAEVTSMPRFGGKGKATLLAKKRPDGLWMSIPSSTIVLSPSSELCDRLLILVTLDVNRLPQTLVTASSALADCLRDWSLRLTRFDSQKAELDLIRESLQYQSTKLYQREQDFKRREELQCSQEKKLETLVLKANSKLEAAELQHVALTEAWKHLNFKEEQVKKGQYSQGES